MTGHGMTYMGSARVVVTRVFGVLVAASAAEHGLGEALQGNRAPAGPFNVLASRAADAVQSTPEIFSLLEREPR